MYRIGLNKFYEVFVGFAHSFAAIARLNSHIDGKNEITKRAIYVVTLDRRLNEIR